MKRNPDVMMAFPSPACSKFRMLLKDAFVASASSISRTDRPNKKRMTEVMRFLEGLTEGRSAGQITSFGVFFSTLRSNAAATPAP